VYLCTRRIARGIVERKLTNGIISITSTEAVRAAPGYATYAAAKAGVINYTKTAALELAPHGIRVNALAPDLTMIEGIRAISPPGTDDRAKSVVPMGRAGHVDEMAGAAVFLSLGPVQLHHPPAHPRGRRDAGVLRLASPSRNRRVRARRDLTQRSRQTKSDPPSTLTEAPVT
jgi:Enoyl-(Acyl carrier protein) reductase